MERTLIRGAIVVIDNLDQTGRLLCNLEVSLPLAARATPVLLGLRANALTSQRFCPGTQRMSASPLAFT